ncbi:MAG: methylmalonyl-CoA mutase [Acidobacteria bacterium]|nr:MAG: methylmalonyl-CoA mutase [Acidobacteriota bacterium]
MREQLAAWESAFGMSTMRDADFETMSGIPLKALYTSDDVVADEPGHLGVPGQYPFTRGAYASGYRTKLWTMRQFSGFGTAEETNERYKFLLAQGGDGLSVAFDLPTLMGRDSDDPRSEGEVGRCGVAVDTLADMRMLFDGIPLGEITTSMTINSPAAILLAMYVAVAAEQGFSPAQLGGTIQNDMLKEYIAQKEYFFPPRPSMRIVTDMIGWCAAEMPRWHTISVSGYHIREAGATAAQELAFTVGDGFAYVEAGMRAGLDVDAFAPRLSFFFNAHIDFFEEIAKYRAARRIWARWLRDRYGAKDPRSMTMRFHTQTAGVSLTAQQPENNIVRTAIEALAGVLGGTQSLHTNSMDEVYALPTEKAVEIAIRTQQVIAHETGVANVADPLGGSYYVEALTDEMERQAEAYFTQVDEMGNGSMLDGALAGIENGFFQREIADASWTFEKKVNEGRRIIVGVNEFARQEPETLELLEIDHEVEVRQQKRLGEVKADRDQGAVDASLDVLRETARSDSNLMPPILDAVRALATVGEVMSALADVFGRYVEDPVV